MKKLLMLSLFFMIFSCSEKKIVLPPNDKLSIMYGEGYLIDFENKKLIVDHFNIFNDYSECPEYSEFPHMATIKINLSKKEIDYLNNLYIKYDIDDINGLMEEAEIFSSKNSASIMFSKNHRISIYEGYAKTNTNRKVVNYLNEINKFLDEKMKDDSLYQKSIKKIKSARRL